MPCSAISETEDWVEKRPRTSGNPLHADPERRMFQWSTVRLLRRFMVLGLVLYLSAWAYRIVTRKYYVWLPGYVSWLSHQAVSYTHLRAHETDSYLVCRLLL